MAYPVATGAILEMAVEWSQVGQRCQNVYHYYMQKTGGIEDGRASALAMMTWWRGAGGQLAALQDVYSDRITDFQFYAQWITPLRYAYIVDPLGQFSGLVDDEPMPVNVQVSLTLRGTEAGRHNLGRKEMGAVPASFIAASQVNVIARGFYDTFAETLLEEHVGPEGEEYSPVIFNRVTPELSPVIVEAFCQATSRVTRRRTVGVGA